MLEPTCNDIARSRREPEHSPRSSIPETARFQKRFTTPLPRPGFVRVAKKLDLVTVSSASVIISRSAFRYSFPIFFFFVSTRRHRSSRDTCTPCLKRRFSVADESWRERKRHLKKNCFRIYWISLAPLWRRFLIFYIV